MFKNNIWINAGKIRRLLLENGTLSIREIEDYSLIGEPLIYYSLGWLAREDKVRFFEKGDAVYVELKTIFTDINI